MFQCKPVPDQKNKSIKVHFWTSMSFYKFILVSFMLHRLWYKVLQFTFITLGDCFLGSVFAQRWVMRRSYKNLPFDGIRTRDLRFLSSSCFLQMDHCASIFVYLMLKTCIYFYKALTILSVVRKPKMLFHKTCVLD